MSIRDCILAKQKAGKVDEERTAEALDLVDRIEADNAGRMSGPDAEARAARETVKILQAEAARRRANTIRQALITGQIQRDMDAYRTASGETNMGRAALGVMARDLTERSPRANVASRYQATLGMIHSQAEAFLAGFRAKTAGLRRNRAGLKNVVRELFGVDTGDEAAAAAARAFGDAAEYARLRFNRAGGAIKKRVDWGLPQSHDRLAVAAVDRDEWIRFVTARLDRGEMVDANTGLKFSDLALFDALVKTYDRIATNGLSDLKPGAPRRRRALANRRQQSRFLVFRDADAWLEYQERFGGPDIFETMNGHFDDMAMDIARMEVLGPDPDIGVQFMKDLVRKDAAGQGAKAVSKANSAINAIGQIDADQTGLAQVPVNIRMARGFQSLRNVLSSAQLGGAALSALSDFAYQRLARSFNGLPAVSKAIPQILRLMNPLDVADQRAAVRMGLVAESWSGAALALKRYTGEVVGPRFSRLFADVVLKVSGLTPFTQAGRHAFGMEFLSHLAEVRGRRIADLPEPTRNALARYGIGEGDWRKIGRAEVFNHRGVDFVDWVKVAERDPEAANKLMQMVLTEIEFAVPTTSSRTRAQLRAGTRPGTFAGEMLRSIALYKSFSVSVIHLHVMRALNREGLGRKGTYLANMIISVTVMGALARQAKEIQRGKDPQDMTDWRFWEAAMIQGGGLGIFGDFLFSDVNRFGKGGVTTLAGPVAAFGDDLFSLTLGNLRQGAEGEGTNLGREAIRFAKRYTPGSSIWYARLGLERLIFDELQRVADPDAARAFRRQETRLRRRTGQLFFSRPGSKRIRPPSLGRALGR